MQQPLLLSVRFQDGPAADVDDALVAAAGLAQDALVAHTGFLHDPARGRVIGVVVRLDPVEAYFVEEKVVRASVITPLPQWARLMQ